MPEVRELYLIDEEKWGDYTKKSTWILDGEVYNFVVEEFLPHEGILHEVIVQRESDLKYFRFGWEYEHGNYYFYETLEEVFPEVITKTVWL